jgi:hypothetical protein
LLIGQAIAEEDMLRNLRDNLYLLPPILASSLMIALVIAGVSLAIACQTSRRAFSTGGVLAYFVVSALIGSILVQTLTGESRGYGLLLSPIGLLEGVVYWLFDAPVPDEGDLAQAGLSPGVYLAGSFAYAAASIAIYLRRMLRTSV